MKRIPCIAIVCLILTLSGCAVKSAANAETVCDPGSGPEPPQFCLAAELPSELGGGLRRGTQRLYARGRGL